MDRLQVQIWSYNYAPEPTGIGPVSTVLAEELRERGHAIRVIAAHPHYPEPRWGTRFMPYREVRNGVSVTRLPLWIGRGTAVQRMRQELTFTASLCAALPMLGRADLILAASPSFPALLPAVMNARLRRVPLVAWLHDVLPDGAVETGLIQGGWVLGASRWLERIVYRRARRIVVLSRPFMDNLRSKGVPRDKLELIYDPATRPPRGDVPSDDRNSPEPARIICMGNIGQTQGLTPLVRAFDRSEKLREARARLVLTGTGVCAQDVRRQISTDAVEMLGTVSDERLERELRNATLGLVTQRHEATEFNLPSKIMNYMAWGLPIIAAVNPNSEVARLVRESQSGWVADSSTPELLPETLASVLSEPEEIRRRGLAGRAFARKHFTREEFAARFESVLFDALDGSQ